MSNVFAAAFSVNPCYLTLISGDLGYGLFQVHALNLAGWRWIYIIEGAISVACALLAWLFLVYFPQRAKFLSDNERARVIQRTNDDRGDGDNDQLSVTKVFHHLRDWKVWGFGLIVIYSGDKTDRSSLEQQYRNTLFLFFVP